MAVKYNEILSIDRIIDVYKNIRSNTRHKQKLVQFELAFSCNIIYILTLLKNRNYKHGNYSVFLIKSPKYRIIMSERITDKIVNHLVSKYVLIPILIPKLIEMNVATRTDKGTKAGLYYTKKYINSLKVNHDKIYVLKCDISKYFYNIDHNILLKKLKKDIEDEELYQLLKEIIDSTNYDYINKKLDNIVNNEIIRIKNKNLKDFEIKKKQLLSLPRYYKGKGLPIGNETSQVLAIYYLNDLDHYIKEKLKIKHYIRYMDDFLLFHYDKEYLKYCEVKIKEKVEALNLQLNKKTQIYDLSKGLNFLGYKFVLKGKRLIILINNQTKKRVKRKLKKMQKNNVPNYEQVKASYNGYFMKANSTSFLHKNKF